MDTILEVRNLKVSFRTSGGIVRAVRDISFTLPRGRTLAIVGESGSGKSVTARTVLRILESNAAVEGGEVLYDGRDLLKISEKEICGIRGSRISMVFQDPFSTLNPIMKVGRQITETMLLGNRGNGKRISRGEAREKALKLMEEVGIPEPRIRFDQYPFEFSGGMCQRIVIAVALAADPDILICDEPTTALDVTIQAQILELIDRLKAQRGLSVIFITHDLGVVARMADDIAVMYAGRIVEFGTAEEVFYDPRHPYTWALLSSVPDPDRKGKLEAIPGTPPNMIRLPEGDAFAARNKYALRIDYEQQPPAFSVSPTHWAATWLLHPDAPKAEPPKQIAERRERMRKTADGESRE